MAGIYVARFPRGRTLVVVTSSAEGAAKIARETLASENRIDPEQVADPEIGRLGNYDPGIAGAYLVNTIGPVVAGGVFDTYQDDAKGASK